ncbi:MAG: lamin tail domain-containing protein [Bacteroidetes bacterium]|nr:lamin tail domain-containing protein [Bacteroidota bacterium]
MKTKLTQSAKIKLKTTFVKYAVVSASLAITVALIIYLVTNFTPTKDAFADNLAKGEVAVEIGTSTGSVNLPISRYYDNSVYEVIYLQSEIAQLGDITKLAFYKGYGSNSTTINTVKIYLKHTTATQFSNGNYSLSGYTLAYSGAFPNSSIGWNQVTLDNAFAYNNSNNLQILVINEYEAWTYSFPYYRYTAASRKARYQMWDGSSSQTYLYRTNYRSNIKITILDSTPPVGPMITNPTAGQLYISEYAAAGHHGYYKNEFIELYNNTDSTIDLSNCSMKLYNKAPNGSGNQKGATLQLTGTLLADSFYVIAVRNKYNVQPTSALPYDIQAPPANNGWELKNKRYLSLLCGTTEIDHAGSLTGHGGNYNYERTDVLVDGTNMSSDWRIVDDLLSSPGSGNISDNPISVAVSSSNYTNFGGNSNNAPAVKIKSNGSSHPGSTSVKVKRGKEHPNTPTGTTMIKRYVEITPSNQPDNVEMVYYYNDSEINGLTESNLKLYSYYDNEWHYQGGVVDPVNNTITVTMINHFSDWGAGEGGGALPVELLSFNAEYVNNHVLLNWKTASEMNNDYFTIERSADTKSWDFVNNVKGAGNTNSISEYTSTDDEKFYGTIYYRLKQTDYDGEFKYYLPVAVNVVNIASEISSTKVSPNPFTNDFNIEFNTTSIEPIEVYMYDARGQLVFSDVFTPSEGSNLYKYSDRENLSGGYYILMMKQNNKRIKGIKLLKR